MPLSIVRNDITKMSVDAIVNTANSSLKMGGGVSGAIFAAAGADALQRECDGIGYCPPGGAVITKGYRLASRHVIHTGGPVWQGGDRGEERQLRECYRSALALAAKSGCRSIAFPLISSGAYGYPKERALRIAVSAIREFLDQRDMDVYLVVFDAESYSIGEALFSSIERYIDDRYAEEHMDRRRNRAAPAGHGKPDGGDGAYDVPFAAAMPPVASPAAAKIAPGPLAPTAEASLGELVMHLDESFSQTLLRLIDERGMSDVEVYRRANMDRRLFSKIRGNARYSPAKPTVLALAIALRLNLPETQDILARAGFALSHSSKADVIVEYFIKQGVYDVYEINEALFAFDQALLGA